MTPIFFSHWRSSLVIPTRAVSVDPRWQILSEMDFRENEKTLEYTMLSGSMKYLKKEVF